MKVQLIEKTFAGCDMVLLVPEKAVTEPGYMQCVSKDNAGTVKHQFHAMTQMAYFQYQDDELEIGQTEGDIVIVTGDENIILTDGMVILRDGTGTIHVVVRSEGNDRKLIESAYRYCTRWVRLDI